MKNEILAGLKNAIDREQSMEQAVQSFINAGYNPQEVKEVARTLSSGASEIIYSDDETEADNYSAEKDQTSQIPKSFNNQRERKGRKILLTGIIIIALLVFLGALAYLIFNLASG